LAQNNNQSSGGFWQKLGNALGGNGWKTDQQIAEENIKLGMPPNGEYSFWTGKHCSDCKFYPKEVTEVVDAHEEQHRKDYHTWSGFKKLYSKEGQRELEVNAFKAELPVTVRNIKALESKGSPSAADRTTLNILYNMKSQAEGVIQNPNVYIP
jgi:hypothetical protein